jgi:phosphomannomutase
MPIDTTVFREYDIRGIFGQSVDQDLFYKIGYAIGKKHPGKRVMVGNDIRTSSEPLAGSLISGLATAGCKISYCGTTCFGETLLAGRELKHDLTLYVTASHLPPEWNGLKMYYGDGIAFSGEEIKQIRDAVLAIKDMPEGERQAIDEVDFNGSYVDYFTDRFKGLKRFKVVLDCGNGSTCLAAPKIFSALGLDVIELFTEPDPEFPNRPSEVSSENIGALKQKVVGEKADFGVAFDGDGDRAAIVDDKGRVITNEVGIVLGKQLLKKRKGPVIATVTCSMLVEKVLAPLGADVKRVPVGHTFIIINSKKHNAVMGMEESGHLVVPEYFYFDDAILVPLLVARAMQETGKKLSELYDELPAYSFSETSFRCDDRKKFAIIDSLKQKLGKEYKRVNTMDGARVDFDDGWILIRASNTSPKIRLYAEAETKERLEELRSKFTGILRGAI